MKWTRAFYVIVLTVLANGPLVREIDLGELIELQRMDDAERRQRLHLPKSCEPLFSVAPAGPFAGRYRLIVNCANREVRPEGPPPGGSPAPQSPLPGD